MPDQVLNTTPRYTVTHTFSTNGTDNDTLQGGNQEDILLGDAGNDLLRGEAGFDVLYGGEGDDTLDGGLQADVLHGEEGNDELFGDQGVDKLYGGTQNDTLNGGADNDTLSGGSGFDVIEGGTGNDIMSGNFNADQFIFEDGFGTDIITDFEAFNTFERIDLSGVTAIVDLLDLTANHLSQVGADAVIDDLAGNTITLWNANITDLDQFDFTF